MRRILLAVFLLASPNAPAESAPVKSTPVFSSGLSVCVRKTKKGYREPATLKALLICQDGARRDYRWNWKKRHKKPIPDKDFAEIMEFQRNEVRNYLRRYPKRAMIEEKKEEKAALNEKRLPAGDRADYRELEKLMKTKSKDGKLGVTSGIVSDILKFLQKKQGGASADMRELLGTLEKDGPDLTDDSMLRLKNASRKAAAEGLDLGVKPDLERWLLDPRTDPKVTLPSTPRN